MENKDKKEFAEIMIALGENFSAKLTKEGLDIRFKVLAKYPLSQVKAACYKVLEERVYPGMPTIGEIIQAMKPTTPQIEDRARVRVSEIMGQIRLIGSHGNPTWDDPIVADLMRRRYNWQNLCAMTETELHWWGKEFVETYRAMDMQDAQQYPQIEHRDMKRLAYGIGNGGDKGRGRGKLNLCR